MRGSRRRDHRLALPHPDPLPVKTGRGGPRRFGILGDGMTDISIGAAGAAKPVARGVVARGFDWTMIVWLVFAAILIVIVVNPIFRLVWESIAAEGGRLTLPNYVAAWSRPRYWQALVNTVFMGVGTALLAAVFGGAARLGRLAHRHAAPRLHQAVRARRLHHPALSRARRLDPARGAELRLAQQGLDGADRRVARASSTSIRLTGLIMVMAAHLFSLHLRVHVVGARTRLVGDGGRGQHPRRRAP